MLTLLLWLSVQTVAATATPDFGFLAGSWSGTLTYLDYKDDTTRQELKVTMTCTVGGDATRYRFLYVEPNGKRVEGDETVITVETDGTHVTIGKERWTVAGRPLSGRVVLERDGNDNGKAVRLSRSYVRNHNELRIVTTATPAGGGQSLVRNTYVLTLDARR
jgi:hypothetical protein